MTVDTRPAEFRNVAYMIEATEFEASTLCEQWHRKIDDCRWALATDSRLKTMYAVGKVGKGNICITIDWVNLNGHLIGFYRDCSKVVDHRKITRWIEKNCCPPGANKKKTNATNFVNALTALGLTWQTTDRKLAG